MFVLKTSASGFVRPKTTSLFYDKLYICSVRPNEPFMKYCPKEVASALKSYNELDTDTFEEFHDNIDNAYYYINEPLDEADTIIKIYNTLTECIHWEGLVPDAVFPAYYCRPKRSDYDYENISEPDRKLLDIFSKTTGHCEKADEAKAKVISFMIQAESGEIVEENLTWEQVIDIRKDTESKRKLHRLQKWMYELGNKSEQQIGYELQTALYDYDEAIKKHGLLTKKGGMTMRLDLAATVLRAIKPNIFEWLASGFDIANKAIAYAVMGKVGEIDLQRAPIAFLYDILVEAGGNI